MRVLVLKSDPVPFTHKMHVLWKKLTNKNNEPTTATPNVLQQFTSGRGGKIPES